MEDTLDRKVFAKVTQATEMLEESAVKQAVNTESLRDELNELQAQADDIRNDIEREGASS